MQAVMAPESLVQGESTLADVTRTVTRNLEGKPGRLWWAGFLASVAATLAGAWAAWVVLTTGIGVAGLNNSSAWGFFIINFVFWVGIGHAGTLISAFLLLMRQHWRSAVNRAAEASAVIAVACAGIFPLLHMGRPWFFYWLIPYPNTRGSVWPNFRSPLLWDVMAVGTYVTLSSVYFYVGMIPDLASLRDRAKKGLKKTLYGFFSLGWDGSARNWSRYEMAYLLLAGLMTPLVLSVHSVVSCDMAATLKPEMHETIFPPYFGTGAIFCGFAVVLTLLLVMRRTMHLQAYITRRHIDIMAKVMLMAACFLGVIYVTEVFIAWYSGDRYLQFDYLNRFFGPRGWAAAIMYGCNMLVPQLLWIRKVRANLVAVFVISLLASLGMWFERWVIFVSSLQADFLPSSWSMYHPTLFDYGCTLGSFGLFFTLFLLFARFLPMIAIAEIKHEVAHGGAPHGEAA